MYGIDLLVQEHKNIIAYTEFMRRLCCDILEGKEVDINAFRECVDFGRNYADNLIKLIIHLCITPASV